MVSGLGPMKFGDKTLFLSKFNTFTFRILRFDDLTLSHREISCELGHYKVHIGQVFCILQGSVGSKPSFDSTEV